MERGAQEIRVRGMRGGRTTELSQCWDGLEGLSRASMFISFEEVFSVSVSENQKLTSLKMIR